jgi:hypothetical protein
MKEGMKEERIKRGVDKKRKGTTKQKGSANGKIKEQAKEGGAKNQITKKKTPNGGFKRKQKIRFPLDGNKIRSPPLDLLGPIRWQL